MINPITFLDNRYQTIRGTLINVSISDLHFGADDPKYQYETLMEQFMAPISNIHFDIMTVLGDFFDHRFMSNSDVIMYGNMFLYQLVSRCRSEGATLIIIGGTSQHDAGQLKMFYHYLNDPTIDIRIIEQVRFEYVKNTRILCIPEMYNMGYEYYANFLFNSETYDIALVHGMFQGAVRGNQSGGLESEKAPIFNIEDFCNCCNCILSGHVHTSGCFNSYFYYVGTPLRWEFGQEEPKGFFITLHNLDTNGHYIHFEEIKSKLYITLNIEHLLREKPEVIIQYILKYKEENCIDFLRVQILKVPDEAVLGTIDLIKKYFRSNNNIKLNIINFQKEEEIKKNEEMLEKYKEYSYILDKNFTEEEILVKYINHCKGCDYITTEELNTLLLEE